MASASETRGQCVARRRTALKLTQEELAIACKCSPRTISRIEQDQFPSMKTRLIQALQKHLSIPLDELINGKRSTRGA